MATECDWPLDPGCLGAEWANLPPEVQERAAALATSTLRRLSGYRVGGCPITVRPCVQSCVTGNPLATGVGWGPSQLADGTWVNSCGCKTDCACEALCEVVLAGPVGPISWVKVDGVTLSPLDYRVDGNRLVWVGPGDCPWPACQDMKADADQPGTFAVRYLRAHAPDASAQWAAGMLAMEFARACTGGKCRLPSTVTSVVRQGVSFQMAEGAFVGGFTGIREIDAWVALWRPQGSPTRDSTVWYPGLRLPRVVG